MLRRSRHHRGVLDPRTAPADIRGLARHERHAAVAALARAFYPDPLFGHFARTPRQEYHLLAAVFDAFVRDGLPFDESLVAAVGQRIVGCAVWLPPGTMPRGAARTATLNARAAQLLLTGRNRVSGLRLLDAVDKVHPTEPHWYLFLLGTDPVVQGRGIGGRLVQPVLDRCDAEGLPAYLETQKESNLAFYGRLGFEVGQKLEHAGAPPIWTMTRAPR